MGYLNKATITVDAILTNRGRQLLAEKGTGTGGFEIKKFAVSDDEIDYSLYNVNHPNGDPYFGNVIENMPLLEATPDESQIMRYKLVNLKDSEFGSAFIDPSGAVVVPQITNFGDSGNIIPFAITGNNQSRTYTPSTGPTSTTFTGENYVLLVSDARILTIEVQIVGTTTYTLQNTSDKINANGSITIAVPKGASIKFGKNGTKVGSTTATIFGELTGATQTVTINITAS